MLVFSHTVPYSTIQYVLIFQSLPSGNDRIRWERHDWHCGFMSHAGYRTSFEVFDIWPWVKCFQTCAFILFHIAEQKQRVTRDLWTGFSRHCEWRVNCDLKPKLKWTSKRNVVSMGTHRRTIRSSHSMGVSRMLVFL